MIFNSNFMNLNINNGTPFLSYKKLDEISFIKHGFSTRLGGVSKNEFFSMNLSFDRGDSSENVIENYKLFAKAVGVDFKSLVSSQQDHNINVRVVTAKDRGVGIYREQDMKSVDALITNDKNVTLVTHYADCTPIFLVDPVSKSIGLVHAGWRGTVKEIAKVTVEAMIENFNANPQDIIVGIGPAISKCCFEVDKPVAEEFEKLSKLEIDKFITDDNNGKYHIDLLECNRQILVSAGVKEENIVLSDLCTKCCSDLLFSHRATKGVRGGMIAVMAVTDD